MGVPSVTQEAKHAPTSTLLLALGQRRARELRGCTALGAASLHALATKRTEKSLKESTAPDEGAPLNAAVLEGPSGSLFAADPGQRMNKQSPQ